nr:MAG TPA: hypothetical protein [Caudoviricetes sp.]
MPSVTDGARSASASVSRSRQARITSATGTRPSPTTVRRSCSRRARGTMAASSQSSTRDGEPSSWSAGCRVRPSVEV